MTYNKKIALTGCVFGLLLAAAVARGDCDCEPPDCNCPWGQYMPPCVKVTFSDVNDCDGAPSILDGEYVLNRYASGCGYSGTYEELSIHWAKGCNWWCGNDHLGYPLGGADANEWQLVVYDTWDNSYSEDIYFLDWSYDPCPRAFTNKFPYIGYRGTLWNCTVWPYYLHGRDGRIVAEGGTAVVEPIWDCSVEGCNCEDLTTRVSPYKSTLYYGNEACCPAGQGEQGKVVMWGLAADCLLTDYTIQVADPCDANDPNWTYVSDTNLVDVRVSTYYDDGEDARIATFTVQANQGTKYARAIVTCTAIYCTEDPKAYGYESATFHIEAQENDCCGDPAGGGGGECTGCGGTGAGSGPPMRWYVGVGSAGHTLHAGADPCSGYSRATVYEYGDGSRDIAVLLPGSRQQYILPVGFMPGWSAAIDVNDDIVVTGPDNLRYVYPDDGYALTTIEQPDGKDVATFTYNGALIDRQYDSASGDDMYIEYHYNDNQLTSLEVHGSLRTYTLVYDPNHSDRVWGFSSSCAGCGTGAYYYEYDDDGRLYRIRDANDPNLVAWEYAFNTHGWPTAVYQGPAADGNIVRRYVYTPDGAQGAVIVDVYHYIAEGVYQVERFHKDTSGRVTRHIQYGTLNEDPADPVGQTFTEYSFYACDANGVLTGKVVIPPSANTASPDPDSGLRRVYEYDPNMSKLLTETWYEVNDVNFTVVTNAYQFTPDGHNVRLVSTVDARDAETVYSYVGNDLVPSYRTMPLATLADGNNAQLRYAYAYDSLDRVLCERQLNYLDSNDLLARTEYQYDAWGNLIKQYRYNAADDDNEVTEYRYDHFNEPNRTIESSGVVSGRSYYESGQLESEFVLAHGQDVDEAEPNLVSQTVYYYDANGRLSLAAKAKDGQAEFPYGAPDGWVWTRYEYDLWGRRTKVIEDVNGLELETAYEYDLQGRQTKVTVPTGRWTQTVRDGRGLTYKTILGHGTTAVSTSYYYYDANGNLEYEVGPDGTGTHYEYDDYDRVIRITRGL